MKLREHLQARRQRRFHRTCENLGIPSDVRQRFIRMAEHSGEKLKAPDWYAGRQA